MPEDARDPTILLPGRPALSRDRRLLDFGSLDFPYPLPDPAAWGPAAAGADSRAAQVRRRIRLAAGIYPEPERTPLKARVFDRQAGDGYLVEKVCFESYPGFLSTGNLFRPAQGRGQFPAVLLPHGHFPHGRLESGAGRPAGRGDWPVLACAITLARLGFVAFAWDMVGYNDSRQVKHRPPHEFDSKSELWGVTPLGLQLWNGVRALDFLETLPDVDARRIGCTGSSGGGTQTYLLAAVDERVRCAVPVCMCSAHYQGGCVCENAPQLRLDGLNNVEVVAAIAPRPVLLISCTGDWTNLTPLAEYPALRRIYARWHAEDRLGLAHFAAPHNYNRGSREAMYAWFVRWLQGRRGVGTRVEEPPFAPPEPEALRVFPGALPARYPRGRRAVAALIELRRRELAARRPRSAATLAAWRERYGPAWRETLAVRLPGRNELMLAVRENLGRRPGDDALLPGYGGPGWRVTGRLFRRRGLGDCVPGLLFAPAAPAVPEEGAPLVVVLSPRGKRALLEADGARPTPLVRQLLAAGRRVLGLDLFLTGEMFPLAELAEALGRGPHSYTYNRTPLAHRLQDVVTAALACRYFEGAARFDLVGLDEAGVWALLAAPLLTLGGPRLVETTVADLAGLDLERDATWAGRFYLPPLRRLGDLRTAAALLAPGRLWLHRLHRSFPRPFFRDLWRAAGAPRNLHLAPARLDAAEIARAVLGGA